MKRYIFGPWVPDLPPLVNTSGCTVARNIVPIGGGYGPMASLTALTGATALAKYCRGAIGGTDFATNAYQFAGDEDDLYTITSDGATAISRPAGYTRNIESRWDFAVFGETVFATNFSDEMQFFDIRNIAAGDTFADVRNTTIAPAAPRARHIGVIDNFLVAGNIFDPVNGLQTGAISWSTINNPLSWPTRGTSLAVASQSDGQLLEGAGGNVNAIVSGSEVGAVFQEHAIWRMDYVGGDVVFSLNRVEPNRGLLIPRLAVPVGRMVFYCSEDGFYLFDYTQSRPIGKDKVNKKFLSDIDGEFFYRVSAIRDPDSTRIFVLYPGANHDATGTPNKMFIYDWALDQFTDAELTAEMLVWSYTAGAHLDSPDIVGDEDSVEGPGAVPPGGVLGTQTFDARATPVDSATLSAYDSTHLLSQFTGPNLSGVIETGDIELNPGYRSLVTTVRPLIDAADVTVQVAGLARRPRPLEPLTYGRRAKQEDHGACSVRSDGRYHRVRVSLPPSFENAVGCDVDGTASGNK